MAPIFKSQGSHRPAECPTCGTQLNRYAGFTDAPGKSKPRPGDMTICWTCVSILIFTKKMNLRDALPREMRLIMANPVIAETINSVRSMRAAQPKPEFPEIGRLDVWKR